MPQREIEDLTSTECFALLVEQVVGRIVFADDDGPGAVPVNYGVAGDEVVFRVEPGSHLRAVLTSNVAFEVDYIDPEAKSGWSVLIRGSGREIDIEDVGEVLRQMADHFPSPWAEGVHNVWVAITPRIVTGRRLAAPFYGAAY